MDPKSSGEKDVVIDVESGVTARGEESSRDGIVGEKHTHKQLDKIWNGFGSIDGCRKGDDAPSLGRGFPNSLGLTVVNGELLGDRTFMDIENGVCLEKKKDTEKPKKKKFKKPPKPPRPPKALSLDAAEEKLVRELSELAMLKRARIERMKALKKMKNAKATSSSSNWWALVITILFCFVIFWQGFCSRSSSNLSFEGSPVSSMGTQGGLISVQYYNNSPGSSSNDFTLTSPNIVEQVSGLESEGGDASAVAR